jgi:hypothetical protein
MKTWFTILMIVLTSHFANAMVQMEIQPLTLKPTSEVIGIHTGAYGQDAVVLTGYAAQKLAQESEQSFNVENEMIVMTGDEVTELVSHTAGSAYNMGVLTVISSAAFASAGLQIAYGAIYTGAKYTFLAINTTATVGKFIVHSAIVGLAHTVNLITSTGVYLTVVPISILKVIYGFVCAIPNYFGHYLNSCY